MSRLSSVVCMTASMFALGAFADDAVMSELSLATDTNAVIDVAEGSVMIIDKISGNRGTITKTGDGVLEVRLLRNSKARFNVQGGRLYFAQQIPSVVDKAFFHVDASRPETLELEEMNGTNFVIRWHDVRGNGNYATNSPWTTTWRPDPQNRRAFISSVTQNGLPVVDFGSMLFNGLTNEVGEIQGYGATMTWKTACSNTREVYEVISDTPDVATVAVTYPRFNDKIHAVSFISSSSGAAANYREKLRQNAYPNVFYDNSNNNAWMWGWVYVDGTKHDKNSTGRSGKFSAGGGFHVMGFTTASPDDGYSDYSVSVNAFARYSSNSCGGQRIGEYLVFSNRLTVAERKILQDYLVEKWKKKTPTYAVSSLTVADGASVEFAPGVRVRIANAADGSDISIADGAASVNPLDNPDAFFHVDADDASTLVLQEVNGTNFVRRWDDVLGNGMYATNYFGTFTYRSDPENRFPFISSETLNGRPVVDFGSLLVPPYTNSAGYGIGYGGCLQWSSRLTANAREVFTVTRDTEDVKTLYSVPGIGGNYYGQSYICDPGGMRGFRYQLVSNNYPPICVDHSNNSAIKFGTILVDGINRGSGNGFKNWNPPAGFHVFNFQLSGAALQPQWFAYSLPKSGNNDKRSWGGTKIAEYMIFPNVLSNDVRTAIYKALRTKWYNEAQAVSTLRNVSVAEGASLSFKWRDLAVTNRLSVGGTLSAAAVSAANMEITAAGTTVSGALTVADGATVTVPSLVDGSFGGLSADTFTLAGGGTVVLSRGGSRRLHKGDYPLMTATGEFTGSIDGWSVDSSAFPGASARLCLGADGVYMNVEPPGSVILIF